MIRKRENPFSRYTTPTGEEAEYEPGSRNRVLRNKLGIRSKRDMDIVEFEALLQAQQHWLNDIGQDTRFTAEMIRKMHQDWLGEPSIPGLADIA